MIIRKLTLIAVLFVSAASTYAQVIQPVVTDDMIPSGRSDQNDNFKSGSYPFPARPRSMWEIGLHGGVPVIIGDVRTDPFGTGHIAWGAGAYVRKGLGYVTSLRLDYIHGTTYGQSYESGPYLDNKVLNGSKPYSVDYTGNPWIPNYKSVTDELSLDFMVNINNVNFHRSMPKLNVYGFGGIGVFLFNTYYDALDANGNIYDYTGVLGTGNANDTKSDRLSMLKDLQDGTYETHAEVADPHKYGGTKDNGDQGTLNPVLSVGAGITYRLGSHVKLGIEHRASYYFDDLADGQRWAGDGKFTPHYDFWHYTSINLGIDLGGKSTEPTWWVNPLNYVYQKLSDLSPENLLKDSDDDGVIDYLDKEPNTPAGTPVDTHGVTLDSDKDGCPDSEDPEPFSTPALPIENCQNVWMTEDKVNQLIDDRLKNIPSAATNWYLPMIFFDFDKYNIRPDAVPQLEYIAEIMKRYPKLKIEVVGNTDVRGGENYNMKLSENRAKSAITYLTQKYGIPESSFVMKYNGESDPIITNAHSEQEHQQNRRVEFHIAG